MWIYIYVHILYISILCKYKIIYVDIVNMYDVYCDEFKYKHI